MIQIRSWVDVADNTGARRATMIGVIGKKSLHAGIGDVITANVKEAAPDGSVKKGEVHDAVVVRTRHIITRADGSVLRFDDNAAVVIQNSFSSISPSTVFVAVQVPSRRTRQNGRSKKY